MFNHTTGFADNYNIPFCIVFALQHQICIIPIEEFSTEYLKPQVRCIASYEPYVNQR